MFAISEEFSIINKKIPLSLVCLNELQLDYELDMVSFAIHG